MLREVIELKEISRDISAQTRWIRELDVSSLVASDALAQQVFLAGINSDSSSSAFWLGYQLAIQYLFGDQLSGDIAAFVINESRSSKPSNWCTSLIKDQGDYLVSGKKDFVTARDQIDCLLVGGVIKDSASDNEIKGFTRIFKVAASDTGLNFEPFKGLPVFKELEKSRLIIEEVSVAEDSVFNGDGYTDFIKPFRLIEDFFVSVSLLGYLCRLLSMGSGGKKYWGKVSLLRELLPLCEARLKVLGPDYSSYDLVVEGFLNEVAEFIKKVVRDKPEDDLFKSLGADLMVLSIGEKARSIRYERALK